MQAILRKLNEILFSFSELKLIGIENLLLFLIGVLIAMILMHLTVQAFVAFMSMRVYYLLLTYLSTSILIIFIAVVCAFYFEEVALIKTAFQINLLYGLTLSAIRFRELISRKENETQKYS